MGRLKGPIHLGAEKEANGMQKDSSRACRDFNTMEESDGGRGTETEREGGREREK